MISHRMLEKVECVFRNEDIIRSVSSLLSKGFEVVVAIDAPLTTARDGKGFRQVDRELLKMGYRVLPLSFVGMAKLTKRAIELSKTLRALGVRVVETHPRSALRSSGCESVEQLVRALGIEGEISYSNRDLLDSIVCAVVALCLDNGCAYEVRASDGSIWLLKRLC